MPGRILGDQRVFQAKVKESGRRRLIDAAVKDARQEYEKNEMEEQKRNAGNIMAVRKESASRGIFSHLLKSARDEAGEEVVDLKVNSRDRDEIDRLEQELDECSIRLREAVSKYKGGKKRKSRKRKTRRKSRKRKTRRKKRKTRRKKRKSRRRR
jgi:hypothetical protein